MPQALYSLSLFFYFHTTCNKTENSCPYHPQNAYYSHEKLPTDLNILQVVTDGEPLYMMFHWSSQSVPIWTNFLSVITYGNEIGWRLCNHPCLFVCEFVTLRNLRFSHSILVTAGLFVGLYVCLSWKDVQATPLVRSSWFIWQLMYSGPRTILMFFFILKSDNGQGHHFCENHIMGHYFSTGSGRNFWLVAKRSL